MILTLQLDCGLAYWYIKDTVVGHYTNGAEGDNWSCTRNFVARINLVQYTRRKTNPSTLSLCHCSGLKQDYNQQQQTITTAHIPIDVDNNSLPENNMYICTLSGMFEEMLKRGKEIQSVQHILINMRKDNNSRTENSMYISTLSGMFEEMVERERDTISTTHTH